MKHALAFPLSFLLASNVLAAAPDKPNIVIILADDLGYGSVGCYGGGKGLTTPNIDRLASEGRRFTQCEAPASVCSPTRYALMTGRYYWRTEIKDGGVLPVAGPLIIETNRLTVASLLKQQGYRTAGFGKWHLGWTTERRVNDWSGSLTPGPLSVGFDHFFGMAENLPSGPHSFIDDDIVTHHIFGEPIKVLRGSKDCDTTTGISNHWQPDLVMSELTAHTTAWIADVAKDKSKPFFLYFAPNAVHDPIVPNPRFTGSIYGKYGDFITELDWSVGEVLNALDKYGLSSNTLVIFTSDNGGVIVPGNKLAHDALVAGLKTNGELRGGKHDEWEGGFREPFIVRWPGKVAPGTVSDQFISHVDMLATFAGLLQVPLPKNAAEDSLDVQRAFTEAAPGAPVREREVLQAAINATYALREGDWKFIERADPPVYEVKRNARLRAEAEQRQQQKRPDQLFNLKLDPGETNNVIAAHPDIAARLKRLLMQSRDQGFTRPGASAAAIPAETASVTSLNKSEPAAAVVADADQNNPAALAWQKDFGATHEQRMKWWRDARFGMFIHWGVYSVPAGVWNGNRVTNGGAEWIMNRGRISMADYTKLPAQFNPDKFNPDEWVALAKNAGMRYIVITAKHHDGFAMFHSQADPFNIYDATPFKRDPVKELADACAKADIKLGFYYSQAQDWNHPGGAAVGSKTGQPTIDNLNHWDAMRRLGYDSSRPVGA
jgi:arylsulfatase A